MGIQASSYSERKAKDDGNEVHVETDLIALEMIFCQIIAVLISVAHSNSINNL